MERRAPAYGTPGCPVCRGKGILYDPLFAQGRGSYTLCKCVEAITLCEGGNPPFEYFDEEKRAVVACPSRPARLALKRIQHLEKRSGIPERYRGKLIDSVEYKGLPESILIAMDYASETVENFGSGQVRGLYLYGPTGVGKTLIACVILNELTRLYQVEAHYAKISRDIIGKLRDTFNPQSDLYGEGRRIEQNLASFPALVIDDFGVQRESPWVNSVLYDLIDTRYENNLLTILTSNEPMDSWKDISGGRVLSRLREMCLEIFIEADDYRRRESKSIRY